MSAKYVLDKNNPKTPIEAFHAFINNIVLTFPIGITPKDNGFLVKFNIDP